ncbi:MAG TPA: SRPBCC family protein [Nevskiaceae bacterium]|nr:SRPBCC family protein [Nevskiaceae bacterium]
MIDQAKSGAAVAPLLEVRREQGFKVPLERLWAIVRDFDALCDWLPPIEKLTVTRGGHNAPGTVRHLDIRGGGFVEEELLEHDTKQHRFVYRGVGGVLPLVDYRSEFHAEAVGSDATKVTWVGHFRRKDPGAHPAAGADDETALATIAGVYDAGLAALQAALKPMG